jgi:Phosphotransferase enzyme family
LPGSATTALNFGRVTAVMVKERLRPKRPLSPPAIPASVELLTPEWLTSVLCAGHPGAHVERVYLGPGSNGSSARRALYVDYDAAGRAAGLPTHLFTKTTATYASRLMIGLTGAAATETEFYLKARPKLQINSPECYYAAHDPKTGRQLIILEDVVKTRGCTFPDARTPLTRLEAEDLVETLASYHGTFWNSAVLGGELATLMTAEEFQTSFNDMAAWDRVSLRGMTKAKDVLPDAVLAHRDRFWSLFMKSMAMHADGPQTVLHDDPHPGNWYRDGEGHMGVFDWQGASRGLWALDFCYAVIAALEPEDRRAWERDLLDLYLGHLEAMGVKSPPSRDQAWLDYRRHSCKGFVNWLYTIGIRPIELQPKDVCLVLLERFGKAMADHRTLELLSEA